MKSPSLDNLYARLDRQIALVESYSEIPSLAFIIKSCRLKPLDYFERRSNRLILYRNWFDEFGNSLQLIKKKVEIRARDVSLDNKYIPCTDLYYGLSIDRIAKMSKLVHLLAGKDTDTHQDCYLISFLGLDNYLRSYMYLYDSWQIVSPLHLGMKNLRQIAKLRDNKYFTELQKIDNSVMPCVGARAWLSFLPASYNFRELIAKEHESLSPIFGRNK